MSRNTITTATNDDDDNNNKNHNECDVNDDTNNDDDNNNNNVDIKNKSIMITDQTSCISKRIDNNNNQDIILHPDNIIDYEELIYLQYRYQFQEHIFTGLQWKALQNAGWKHHSSNNTYTSPATSTNDNSNNNNDIKVFKSAIELQQYLDRASIKPITNSNNNNNWNNIDNSSSNNDVNTDDTLCKELRNSVCYHMQLLIEKSRYNNKKNNDDDENNKEQISKEQQDKKKKKNEENERPLEGKRGRSSRLITNNNNNMISSVTASERGANLYLHRTNTNKNTTKKRKISNNKETNDNDSMTTFTAFPTIQECQTILLQQQQQIDSNFTNDIIQQQEQYNIDNMFTQWKFYLHSNNNSMIILYGYGSKYNLLQQFVKTIQRDVIVIQINCFDPDANIDDILLIILTQLVNDNHAITAFQSLSTLEEKVKQVVFYASVQQHPLYLILHSLDCLRTNAAQKSILTLATTSNIHVIASVDHVDAVSFILDNNNNSNTNSIVWMQVHTYRPYIHELVQLKSNDNDTETTTSNKKRSNQRGAVTSTTSNNNTLRQSLRVIEVLKNLAPRYTEALQVLGELQLNNTNNHNNNNYVDYDIFFIKCKNKFLVDKQTKLDTLLIELKDHNLINIQIDNNNTKKKVLYIPHKKEIINDIINFVRKT